MNVESTLKIECIQNHVKQKLRHIAKICSTTGETAFITGRKLWQKTERVRRHFFKAVLYFQQESLPILCFSKITLIFQQFKNSLIQFFILLCKFLCGLPNFCQTFVKFNITRTV